MLSFLFPKRCALCGKILNTSETFVCNSCNAEDIFLKEPLCFSCGKPLESEEQELCSDCKKHPKIFKKGIGLCSYQGKVKQSLWAIKYKNQKEFIDFFIVETICRKRKLLMNLGVDCIVPVPLHPKKKRQRGFNQAEVFAEGIGKSIKVPVTKKLVKRNVYTKPQKVLNSSERRKNLRNAFVGDKKQYQILGKPKRILVIDDIYTTGATAEGVTKALMNLGALEVYIFCIAIGKGFS